MVEHGGAPVALSLLTQAASGLAHLHSHGIIVSDLKPDNLLVQATNYANPWKSAQLAIADLDLACSTGSSGRYRAGTRGYLAPELLDGEASVTTTTDVFALGAWLVWLVSGREPFQSELTTARLRHLIEAEIANPTSRVDPRFASALWGHILGRMLDPDPTSRLRDGLELLGFLSLMASNDDGWKIQMPGLIRNPLLGAPSNTFLAARIVKDRNESFDDELLVVQYERSERFDEFLGKLLTQLAWDKNAPVIVGSNTSRDELFETIRNVSDCPIVLDALDMSTQLELPRVAEILELIHLSRRSSVSQQRYPVMCFIPSGFDAEAADSFKQLGRTKFYRAMGASHQAFHSWLEKCFTSIPIQRSVMARLESAGALDPVAVVSLIGLAEAEDGLQMVSGEVGLIESRAEILISEAARASSEEYHLADGAKELYALLATLPLGIDLRWLKTGGIDTPWSRAASQLEVVGLIIGKRTDSGSIRHQVARHMEVHLEPANLSEVSGLIRAIDKGAGEAAVTDQDESLIAIRFLGASLSSIQHRRGRVLARSLAMRGNTRVLSRLFQLRREVHPTIGGSVATVVDLLLEAKARIRVDSVEAATPLFELAVDLAHSTRIDWLLVRATLTWSIVQCEYGHRDSAERGLEECLRLLSLRQAVIPHQLRMAISLHVIRMRISEPIQSDVIKHFQLIVEDPVVSEATKAVAFAKWGRRLFGLGEGAAARVSFCRALRLMRTSRQAEVIGAVLSPLAIYHFRRGYMARAGRLFDTLESLPPEQLAPSDRIACLSGAGALEYEQGRIRKAYEINVYLYELAKRMEHRILQSSATQNLGNMLNLMNLPAYSRRYLAESIRVGRGTASEFWMLALIHLAECESELGRFAVAEGLLAELDDHGSTGSVGLLRGFTKRLLGRIRIRSGNLSEGRELLEEAARTFEGLKAADEIVITKLDIYKSGIQALSGSEPDTALGALEQEAVGLRSWRITAMVRLARLQRSLKDDGPGFEEELRSLISDALDRGFVALEVEALRLLIERLIWQGWIHEAQDAMKAAMARIKVAADGFTDPELRRAYLTSPGRRAFQELSVRLRQAN